ncbi:MAG: hypothetical protein AAF599_08815 [Bacteroidota bacterium]
MSKNKETDFQAITDLVAVHALTQLAWQNSQEVREEESVAEHQSDSQEFEEIGGHHSDSDIQLERAEVNPVTFAWRLMKLLRRFFEGR